jgi:hypothetical protein
LPSLPQVNLILINSHGSSPTWLERIKTSTLNLEVNGPGQAVINELRNLKRQAVSSRRRNRQRAHARSGLDAPITSGARTIRSAASQILLAG